MNSQLVELKGCMPVTSSVKVAEVFHKQHKNVLQAIERIECSAEFNRLNFQPVTYLDAKNETRPMFMITRDGFSFLAMGFTGKKAAAWKEQYINAFNQMEQALLNQQNLSWQQARIEGKSTRRDLTDTVSMFVDYASAQGSSNARLYFQNITKMTYKALFMVKVASPKPFRDMLDVMQTSFLSTAEYVARQALIDGMAQQLAYKDIYSLARERVTTYAMTLPTQRLISSVAV